MLVREGRVPGPAGVWEPMFSWDASMESSFSLAAPELQPPATPDVPSITSPVRPARGGRSLVPLRWPRAPTAVTVTVGSAGVLGAVTSPGDQTSPSPARHVAPAAAQPALAACPGGRSGRCSLSLPWSHPREGSGAGSMERGSASTSSRAGEGRPCPSGSGGLSLSSWRLGAVENGEIQEPQEEASAPRDLARAALLGASVSPALRQGGCLPT